MEFIVAYLDQNKIDLAEVLIGRRLTYLEKEPMYQRTSVTTLKQAERLVEHFRLTGHISYLDNYSTQP